MDVEDESEMKDTLAQLPRGTKRQSLHHASETNITPHGDPRRSPTGGDSGGGASTPRASNISRSPRSIDVASDLFNHSEFSVIADAIDYAKTLQMQNAASRLASILTYRLPMAPIGVPPPDLQLITPPNTTESAITQLILARYHVDPPRVVN